MATSPPPSDSRSVSPDLGSEHSALISSRNNLLEEANWFFTEYPNFIVNDEATYYHLLTIKNEVDLLRDKYKKIHEQIQHKNVSFDKESHFETITRFILFISKANAALKAFEAKITNTRNDLISQQSVQPATTASQHANFNLPQIPLPHFDGNFSKWQAFSSAFMHIIGSQEQISSTLKFFYLRQTLSGEALARVEHIDVNEKGFEVAWKLLEERYDNKRLIATNHITAIESPPAVKRNCAQSLRAFIDFCKSHIAALQALELKNLTDLLYMHKMLLQLDSNTVKEWEKSVPIDSIPTIEKFWNFLESQCKVMDAVASSANNSTTIHSSNATNFASKQSKVNHFQSSNQNNVKMFHNLTTNCTFCRGSNHMAYKCNELLKLQPSDRWNAVKSKNLCFNCLKPHVPNHGCSTKSCFHCGKAHHSILHSLGSGQNQQKGKEVTSNNIHSSVKKSSVENSIIDNHSKASSSSVAVLPQLNERSMVSSDNNVHSNVASSVCLFQQASVSLLPTAQVFVEDSQGNLIKCVALLDSGSDCNLISQHLADKLALPAVSTETTIHSIGGNQSKSTYVLSILVKSTDQQWSTEESCIVIDKVPSSFSNSRIEIEKLEIPSHISLADPNFFKAKNIDLLLGAGVFASVLSAGQIVISKDAPILQSTRLGWIIFGSCKVPSSSVPNSHVSNFLSTVSSNTPCQLEKFWALESVIAEIPPPDDIVFSEKHYEEHTHRQEDGRFIVSLPKKESFHTLGESKFQALKRFKSLEQRLARNNELKSQYVAFMEEYKELQHMTKVDEPTENQAVYYIPHHPVFKLDSTTTKLRVVFDCSAKTSTGVSLNDVLHIGHTVQPELFETVLRFRTHLIAFAADIAKMYRQILLDPADRDLHRIFWRDDINKPVEQYRLNTVTYGSGPAAFLATRTLIQLADMEARDDISVSQVIKNDFYVDDLLSGCNTLEQAVTVSKNLISTLEKGGFQLRKWMSNSTDLLSTIPSHLLETSSTKAVANSNDTVAKALGLIWNSTSDMLSISSSVGEISHKTTFTKREFLSCIASIFDPLGLISPIVIAPKILFQELWLARIGWDDSLPPGLLSKWLKILQELHSISNINIPRCVISADTDSTFELHGFSDASLKAYGACIYVRSVSSNGIKVHLLCSKSRVAPLKALSIPKLELCAAHLLSRLINKVLNAIKLPISNVFLWSDSQTVCDWIKTPPDRKNVFCSTRIFEIQESTSSFHWNHVRTSNNPSDLISRGCSPLELMNCKLWWSGPSWLSSSRESWDSFSSNVLLSESTRVSLVINSNQSVLSNLFVRCSNYHKMVRSAAYVLRYLHNLQHPDDRKNEFLSVDEINNAEICLIKAVQADAFSSDLKELNSNSELSPNSTLHPFTPFIDNQGVLRVGGRLELTNLPYDTKHQIILPNKHKFTYALIVAYHRRSRHAGVQSTMASLRQRYWIISTRRTIKRVLKTCKMCFQFSTIRSEQIMGQLPHLRTKIDFPFYTCGIDYAGPISIRLGGPKSKTFSKAYLALFICMVTRAIHVEIVSELSSNAFIAALIRFVARRGIPHHFIR
ncbi:uncharacterized protein LOC120352500 [Nilaparvata lugens]|uniref:uncharacterized protein LOC120352500 n=1 Tax=Nilaparvata lugens TaxID=108931 RepID=UPI00193D3470|nr:uncharacterized protein LOC120352500 [Nilaparvata lugens]